MNKLNRTFRVFLLVTGIAALVIRLSTLVVDTSLSIDFTGFQAFALVSFALYAVFAVITLILSFLSLKKTSGSAVPGQILYIACLFVLLAVVLNLPAFFKATALDFSSATPAFVAVNSSFLFNYGKGFGSIAIGEFTNYFWALPLQSVWSWGLLRWCCWCILPEKHAAMADLLLPAAHRCRAPVIPDKPEEMITADLVQPPAA